MSEELGIARSHLNTAADLHNQSGLRKMGLPSQEFRVKKKNTPNVKFIMCYYRSCQTKSLITYNNSHFQENELAPVRFRRLFP